MRWVFKPFLVPDLSSSLYCAVVKRGGFCFGYGSITWGPLAMYAKLGLLPNPSLRYITHNSIVLKKKKFKFYVAITREAAGVLVIICV
jgi:hypothetical protein